MQNHQYVEHFIGAHDCLNSPLQMQDKKCLQFALLLPDPKYSILLYLVCIHKQKYHVTKTKRPCGKVKQRHPQFF